jgi:hypothetical protein
VRAMGVEQSNWFPYAPTGNHRPSPRPLVASRRNAATVKIDRSAASAKIIHAVTVDRSFVRLSLSLFLSLFLSIPIFLSLPLLFLFRVTFACDLDAGLSRVASSTFVAAIAYSFLLLERGFLARSPTRERQGPKP